MRRNLYILWLFWLVGCTEERIVTAPPTDHQPPFITWHEPVPNAELSGDAEIAFMATDPSGVSRISVFRNGLNPPDWTFTPESQDTLHTLIWNTRDETDGLYILEVRAWDDAGNLGVSPSLVVRVRNNPDPPPDDQTPPELWWESPEGGATLKDSVTLRLHWFDELGVDSVAVWRNGRRSAVFTLQGADGVQEIFWDTSQDSDGVYLWEARGWDAAGNEGRSSGLLVRVQNHQPPREDNNPPVLSWVALESGSELSGVVTLRFQILDDVGVDSVRVFKNGRSPEGFYLPGRTELDYELGWNTIDDADGVYLLEVRAWDAAGNLGVSPGLVVTVVNNRPMDRTPPDVWWLSPDPGATLQDTLTLRLRAFDENGVDSVNLYLDGLYRGNCHLTEDDWFFRWDTRSDSDGVHLWEARGYDPSGNEGRSSGLLVRVQNHEQPPEGDRTPPSIVWRAPQLGDTLEGVITLRVDALDNDRVDSVAVYINGARPATIGVAGHQDIGYEVQWDTRENADGVYTLWARAWDRAGNLGLSEPMSVTVWNNRPRVIWVPDDFEHIQDAIVGAADGDTIMVRAGTYEEQLQFFDKNVSLISESGPEETIIDGTANTYVVWITGGQDSSMIVRGFTFINESDLNWRNCLLLGGGASARIVNNIFISTFNVGALVEQTFAPISNNLFISSVYGIQIAHSWGSLVNNMFIDISQYAIWDATNGGQELVPDYNLFWNCTFNGDERFQQHGWGENNITNSEPRFIEGSYRLQDGSPGINQGDPNIQDVDGSRSDIGVYGGPYAYPQ